MDVVGHYSTGDRPVLIAVDDPRFRLALERLLQLRGFATRVVRTAPEAVEAVRVHRPAAAIVDLDDGSGAALDVAVTMPLPQPVITLSAEPTPSALSRLRPRTRAIDKPCSIVLLIETLEEMLASARIAADARASTRAPTLPGADGRPSLPPPASSFPAPVQRP